VKSEGSLPCSQQPTTCPCTEPDASNPHLTPYFPKTHSGIVNLL